MPISGSSRAPAIIERQLSVLPRRSSMMYSVMSAINPKRASNSRTSNRPPSEVTRN
jgi:hypothetical protein